jgi:N-acetylglucosamine kinase-like BadF-type ATPase
MTDGPRVLLGIDGGNTKTIALVAAPDGTILGTGRVDRQADVYKVGVERSVAVYREAADLALSEAGVVDTGATVALSLAGADWPEDAQELRAALADRWPDAVIVNDAIGALRAAVPEGPAVVVVCGTGTATGARGPHGTTWYSGFWQETQGAHELGVRTLQAIYRSELGIDPPTSLTSRVLDAMGEPTVEDVLHRRSGRHTRDLRDPGMVAWILLEEADAGDPAAAAIVAEHGASLGATALAAARTVRIDLGSAFRLALGGGVFREPARLLRDATVGAVRAQAPAVEVVKPELEPAAGALLLAFDTAGLATGPEVRARIARGGSSRELFQTHPTRSPRT